MRDKLSSAMMLLLSPAEDMTAVETEAFERMSRLDVPKDIVTGPKKQAEKNHFSTLYCGDVPSGPLEPSSTAAEDYYAYLETWYRAQKGLRSHSVSPLPVSNPHGGHHVQQQQHMPNYHGGHQSRGGRTAFSHAAGKKLISHYSNILD
jgi:hypothetical protein